MRHSLRRTLSRHQRNADELDREVDLYANESTNSLGAQRNISSRLRQRQIVPLAAAAAGANTTTATATVTSVTATTSNILNAAAAIAPTNPLHINHLNDDQDDDDDDDLTDPDDNKPLRYVASLRHTSSVPSVDRSAVASVRKRIFSDDENIAGPSSSSTTVRSTRTKKRPYYNEDSDDSAPATNPALTKRRYLPVTGEDPIGIEPSRRGSVGTIANNHSYGSSRNSLAADDNENSEDDVPVKSVSSRGRIRKITAKARGLFRE